MTLALSLAVFYELFWLDLFPAGTYTPPNALLPLICTLSIGQHLQPAVASTFFLPVMLTLPLGFLGAFLERKHRDQQAAGYNRLLLAFRANGSVEQAASVSIGLSLAQLFVVNFGTFFCINWLMLLLIDAIISWQGSPLTFSHATWPILWAFGAVGGVISLRSKSSHAVFVTGSLMIFLSALWGVRF